MNIPDQRHYLYLLIAILLELMVYPFVQTAPYKGMVLNVLSTVVLIAAVFVIGVTKNQRFISLALGGFAFLGIWYIVFIEPRYYLGILSVICRVAFDLYVIALILFKSAAGKRGFCQYNFWCCFCLLTSWNTVCHYLRPYRTPHARFFLYRTGTDTGFCLF
jgi:hypothetical protein